MRIQNVAVRGLGELSGLLNTPIFGRGRRDAALLLPSLASMDAPGKRLLIGPTNSAGQAHLWAQAAKMVPGWTAVNLQYAKQLSYSFDSDYFAFEKDVVYAPVWARATRRIIEREFDAVLNESLKPLFGSLHLQDAAAELRRLKASGLWVAVLCHGSDIRVPSVQRTLVDVSVFDNAAAEDVETLERISVRNNKVLDSLDVPVFVSTPDLLKYRPEATWLPIQVGDEFLDAAEKEPQPPSGGMLTVLHLPSRGYLKGTQWIGPQMEDLEARGIVRYLTPGFVPHERMAGLVSRADVVIDAVGMGAYGVTSLEAMAMGRVVVAHVGDFVRERVWELTGLEIPIVEADPKTVGQVVEEIAAMPPEQRQRLGEAGQEYVLRAHSREAAARALTPFLTAPKL